MPDLNVCTGPAFGVGDAGELVLAGSGSQLWTEGPIASNNGLNTDPVNGLWTAPHGCWVRVPQQFQDGLSQTLTAGTPWPLPTTAFTFTNPSSAGQVRLMAQIHARMTVNLSAASLAYLSNSPLFVGGSVVRIAYGHLSNPTASTASGLSVSAWDSTTLLVPAGSTATLNVTASANLVGAGATLTNWSVWVQFIAWLLDPTQEGSP